MFVMRFAAKQRLSLLSILLLTAMIYLPALHGSWITDDFAMIGSKFSIQRLGDWRQVFATGYTFDPINERQPATYRKLVTYRPLSIGILLSIKGWFGSNPLPFHLVSLCLHLLAVSLVWFIASHFLRNPLGLFFVTALFAFHPFLPDAVAWINGISDPLMFCWLALAILAVIKIHSLPSRLAVMAGCYALALISKETAIVFMVFAPLLALQQRARRRDLLWLCGVLIAVTLVYLYVRKLALQNGGWVPEVNFVASEMIYFPLFVIWSVFRLTALFDINVYLKSRWFTGNPLSLFLAITSSAACILGIGYAFYQTWRRRQLSVAWLWGCSFLLFLLPIWLAHQALNAAPRMYYAALLSLLLLAGLAVDSMNFRLPQTLIRTVAAVMAALVFCAALSTSGVIADYASDDALMSADLRVNPDDIDALNYYSKRLLRVNRIHEAIGLAQHAVQLQPENLVAHERLGWGLFKAGNYDLAGVEYRWIVERQPEHCNANYNLARMARTMKKHADAKYWATRVAPTCVQYPYVQKWKNRVPLATDRQ